MELDIGMMLRLSVPSVSPIFGAHSSRNLSLYLLSVSFKRLHFTTRGSFEPVSWKYLLTFHIPLIELLGSNLNIVYLFCQSLLFPNHKTPVCCLFTYCLFTHQLKDAIKQIKPGTIHITLSPNDKCFFRDRRADHKMQHNSVVLSCILIFGAKSTRST